ncbi:MAG TPA: hypothetical protein VJ722_10595, partial [Rhodanobacteraceae bacterium]|nr:hypothetical protein [Rhodanobacteraceae bacterium]
MSVKERPTSGKSRRDLLDELYYLRDVAGEREQRILRLEAALSASGGEREEKLVRLEAELARARTDLTSVLSSRSWRLTAPLRALTRWFATRVSGEARAPSPLDIAPSHSRNAAKPSPHPATEEDIGAPHERDDIPRLYVDVSEVVLQQGRTGIQRVVRQILRALLKSPPARYHVEPIYAAPGRPYCLARVSLDGAPIQGSSPQPVQIRPSDIFLGLDHSMESIVEHATGLEAMKKGGARLYFLCNDTLPLSRPDWFPPRVSDLFEAWLTTIGRVADGIICISRATESDLRSWLDRLQVRRDDPLALGHFHLGADLRTS